MSDVRLRDELEREGRRVSLEPGASERMFERRERRDRRRRAGAVTVAIALAAGVFALLRSTVPGRRTRRSSPGLERSQEPTWPDCLPVIPTWIAWDSRDLRASAR